MSLNIIVASNGALLGGKIYINKKNQESLGGKREEGGGMGEPKT